MRGIRFRAWDKASQRMVIFDEFWLCSEYQSIAWKINESSKIETEIGTYYLGLDEDEIKIMQFTGLRDKNGKEVFEGDIIMYRNDYSGSDLEPSEPHNDFAVIEFVSGSFVGVIKQSRSVQMVDTIYTLKEIIDDGEIEVIGNIFENPDLLHGKTA